MGCFIRQNGIYIIQPTKTRNGCVMINGSTPKITRVVLKIRESHDSNVGYPVYKGARPYISSLNVVDLSCLCTTYSVSGMKQL